MTFNGHTTWYIPDGYLSPNAPELEENALISHEAVCVLNVTGHDARVTMTFYFEDREPIRDVQSVVPAERTLHIRLDKPEMLGGAQIPIGVPYAIRVESNVPIIVQHSRMDVTQPALTLMTTMAWPAAT
jgi:hypothetical protein